MNDAFRCITDFVHLIHSICTYGSTNMCNKAGGLAMDQFDQAPSGTRAQYPGALAMLTVMYDRVQAVCEVRTCVCVCVCVCV